MKNELVDLSLDLFGGVTILWLIKNVKNELVDLYLVPFDGEKFFFSASGLVESEHCLKTKLTNM